MKYLSKIIVILIMSVCIYAIMPQNITEASVSSMVKDTNPGALSTSVGTDLAKNVIKKILAFLQVASGLVSVLIIAFSGFRYVMAETADIKGEVKKKMLPMILGMVLVFSATSIAKFLLGAVTVSITTGEPIKT